MFENLGIAVFDFCKTAPHFDDLLFGRHTGAASKAFFIDPNSSEATNYIDGGVITNLAFRIELKDDFSEPKAHFKARELLNRFILWMRENYQAGITTAKDFKILAPPNKSEVQNNNEAIWETVLQLTFGE